MREFSAVRSRRVAYSTKPEKILVVGYKCPKCGHERSIKETPLQKEKPRESRKIFVQSPHEILSQ
jgi:transcription elongation factor Elf1